MSLANSKEHIFLLMKDTLMADANYDAAPEAVAPVKAGNPWLITVIVAVAALGIGLGTAYFLFGAKGGDESYAEESEGQKTKAKAKDKKPKEPAQYVKLDPPFVVNFEAKGLMRFLQVTVEVMTRDAATVDVINRNDPMIRNDLIMLFASQGYERISTREGKEQLREEALKVVANAVNAEGGDGKKVEQLYFTSFVMQ